MLCVVLVQRFGFRYFVATLSYTRVIRTKKYIRLYRNIKSWSSICYKIGVICISIIIELSNMSALSKLIVLLTRMLHLVENRATMVIRIG